MKLLLILLFISPLAAAQYVKPWVGPETYKVTVHGLEVKIPVNGVETAITYKSRASATAAATLEAQRCNCVPVVIPAPFKVGVEIVYDASSSSKSSMQSSSAKSSVPQIRILTMGVPKKYTDGSILLASNIGGYQLRINELIIHIPPQENDPVIFEVIDPITPDHIVRVAVYDKQDRFSEFVRIPVPIKF